MKKIIPITTLLILTACSDVDIGTIEVEHSPFPDFTYCVRGVGIEANACPETRAYNEQINNQSDSRSNPESYRDVSLSDGPTGTWMLLYDQGPDGDIRETCSISPISSTEWKIDCEHTPYPTLTYDQAGSKLTLYTAETERTDDYGDPVQVVTEVSGVMDDNIAHVHRHRTSTYVDNSTSSSSQDLLYLVKLSDTPYLNLGALTLSRISHGGQLNAMEVYDIYGYQEIDNYIYLHDSTGELLASFPNNVEVVNTTTIPDWNPLYGIRYRENYFSGVNPYLFDGIDDNLLPDGYFHLRVRQFDYLKHDTEGFELDFLINRVQANRYQRDDTVGDIVITF